jgi:DNA-binding GntR family transcriptional regulator
VPSRIAGIAASGESSRTATAYDSIRSAIVSGHLRPNERLIEKDLAERLQISRTPIRESFQRLAGEGLIKPSGQGWVVREHTKKDVREIYEVRAALEGYAARLATQQATSEELGHIAQLFEAHSHALHDEDRTSTLQHNDEFHDAIVTASGNAYLARQIRQNREYYFMQRVAAVLTDDELHDAMRAHQSILDGLLARDEEKAEDAARSLLMDSMARALARLP